MNTVASRRLLNILILTVLMAGSLVHVGCFYRPKGHDAVVLSGTISGRVTASGTIQSSLVIPAALRGAINVADVSVWLQSYPDIRVTTNASGVFRLTGLPLEIHRVVANIVTQGGQTYKVRSGDIDCSPDVPERDAGDMTLEFANNRIQGVLLDSAGNPIAGAKMTLWGETFYTDANGAYTTPPLPDSAALEEILVKQSGNLASASIPAAFSPGGTPLLVTILKNSSEGINVPKAFLVADIQPGNPITPGMVVNLWAVTTYDKGDPRTLSQRFELLGGTLASGTAVFPAALKARHPEIPFDIAFIQPLTWTAPSVPGHQSLRLVVWDAQGLQAIAQHPLNVWPNKVDPPAPPAPLPPRVTIQATTPVLVNQSISLVASASDPLLNLLSYEWSATSGVFSNVRNATAIWTAPAATGTYVVQCRVTQLVTNPLSSVATFAVFVTAPPIEVKPGMIAGHLLDEHTDEPIQGALVAISGTSFFTITDSNGFFEFINLEPGIYDLIATRDHFQTRTFTGIVVP